MLDFCWILFRPPLKCYVELKILQLNGDKLDDSMLLPNDYSQNEEQTSNACTVTTVRRRRRRRKRLIDTLKIIENKLSSQQDSIKFNENTNGRTSSVVIDDDEDGKTGQNNMTSKIPFYWFFWVSSRLIQFRPM